jgi:hypothetical protein
VLEGKSSKKSFPDFDRALLLSGGVGVEDGDGVGELGPKIGKAPIHRVLEQIAFMLVQGHPDGLLSVVDGEVSGGDELTSECTRVNIQRYWMPRASKRPQMWRGTSSWHLTLQLTNRAGAGKSPARQAREESRSSRRASER